MTKTLRHYWLAILLTIAIWAGLSWQLGTEALVLGIVLTLLEITFSFDNAVVNSRVLVTMSVFWQRLFITLGIIVAVFVVRFLLPIFIVMIGSHLGFAQAIDLALHHPHQYSQYITSAAPMINAFGATFLLLVSLYFFMDRTKQHHWIHSLERSLHKLAGIPNAALWIVILIMAAVTSLVDPAQQIVVGISAASAVIIYLALHFIRVAMSQHKPGQSKVKHISHGWAALAAFIYLEVLDASFSLDGVVGAFALTTNIVIIMAGLGAGAVWVRSMTLHLVRTGALAKHVFLESGAHWAIFILSIIMLLKIFEIELPEWLVGSVGLVLIGLSLYSSRRLNNSK